LPICLLLRKIPSDGELATFTVLLAVWAGDIGAFFAGRLIGRHKLAPALSPGKTWEGFLFGTAATIFVTFVALYKQHYLSIWQSIVLGAVIAIAAPLGDLFESALKRDMQVKDSGRLLAAPRGRPRPDRFVALRGCGVVPTCFARSTPSRVAWRSGPRRRRSRRCGCLAPCRRPPQPAIS